MKIVLFITVLFIAIVLVIGLTFSLIAQASNTTITLTQTQTTTKSTTITVTVFNTLVTTIVTTKTMAFETSNERTTSISEVYTEIYKDEGFGLCAIKMSEKAFLLYLADTPGLWCRGYRNKTDVDFMGIGAVGMIFLNKDGWGNPILLDMGIPLGDKLGVGGVIQVGNKLLYVPLNVQPLNFNIVKIDNYYQRLGAKLIAFIEYDKDLDTSNYFNNIYEIELECTR